jgi:hypothetical protein
MNVLIAIRCTGNAHVQHLQPRPSGWLDGGRRLCSCSRPVLTGILLYRCACDEIEMEMASPDLRSGRMAGRAQLVLVCAVQLRRPLVWREAIATQQDRRSADLGFLVCRGMTLTLWGWGWLKR